MRTRLFFFQPALTVLSALCFSAAGRRGRGGGDSRWLPSQPDHDGAHCGKDLMVKMGLTVAKI